MQAFKSIMMAITLVSVSVAYNIPVVQATGCIFANFGGGAGVSGNPLLVTTAAHVTELQGDSSCWGHEFLQTADISMGGITWTTGIGNTSTNFTGTYDGDGHLISDLTISPSGATTYVGLFGTSSGTIRDLGFSGTVTSTGVFVGGLVGSNTGTITGSFVTGNGSVSGANFPGGLVGFNGNGTINNSFSTIPVTASDSPVGYAGGLVGSTQNGTVTNSFAIGTVTANYNKGLAAEDSPSGIVTDSYWDTQTSGAASSAGGTGKTTLAMKTLSTFASWDISDGWSPSDTWGICSLVNSGYPFLTAFYSSDPCSGLSTSNNSTSTSPATYSFTFNTSTGGRCLPDFTVTRGQFFALPDQSVACTPERTRLVGWSIPNHTGGNFSAGGTVLVSGSQTFTAVAENPDIEVIYDPNIGYTSPDSGELVSCYTPSGANIHTALNSTWVTESINRDGTLAATPACAPRGLTFSGWSEVGSPNGQNLSPGSTVPTSWNAAPNPINSIHLYAVWSYSVNLSN